MGLGVGMIWPSFRQIESDRSVETLHRFGFRSDVQFPHGSLSEPSFSTRQSEFVQLRLHLFASADVQSAKFIS